MLFDLIHEYIGQPPIGYEWLEYVITGVFFIYLFQGIFDFLTSITRSFRG